MKKTERFSGADHLSLRAKSDKGVALIIVILVMTFLLTIGLVLLTVTGTGPQVAGNIRWQHQAFNAAEAGFDAAWKQINENIIIEVIKDFSGQYRTIFDSQPGLDDPESQNYFRKLTDQQIVEDVLKYPANSIFASQPLAGDNRFTYTVFLISDEAGGFIRDDMDAILVCIGQGPQNTYARLEIEIEILRET